MKKKGKVESLSYQYGLLAGLEIARQMFETMNEGEETETMPGAG